MQEVFNKYGCKLDKFSSIKDLEILINKFNKLFNITELHFNFCKDDTNIFVLINNYYVIKLYSSKQYQKIFDIYSKIKSTNNIERIYYYCSVSNGLIIHDTYPFLKSDLWNINATISELLNPIFNINGDIITTNIIWNKITFKKLLLDTSKALETLHNEKIVHGDTTPDNIGLRYSDGNFVLFDFGSVKFNEDVINDINRFLKSLLTTYKSFFQIYHNEINNIYESVNKGHDFQNCVISMI